MLNIKAFSFAGAILWSAVAFILALTASAFDWGTAFVDLFSSIYIGYEPGFVGGIVGAVWGFVDALIGCALFAWLYNMIVAKSASRENVTVVVTE